MNIGVHVSFSILVSSGYMPSNGTAGSYSGFIPSVFFFFLRTFRDTAGLVLDHDSKPAMSLRYV